VIGSPAQPQNCQIFYPQKISALGVWRGTIAVVGLYTGYPFRGLRQDQRHGGGMNSCPRIQLPRPGPEADSNFLRGWHLSCFACRHGYTRCTNERLCLEQACVRQAVPLNATHRRMIRNHKILLRQRAGHQVVREQPSRHEEAYRILFECAPTGYYLHDLKGYSSTRTGQRKPWWAIGGKKWWAKLSRNRACCPPTRCPWR